MSRHLWFSILGVLLLASPRTFGQGQTGSNPLQSQLERLRVEWYRAFDQGDGAAMDRMEVPNLVLVNTDNTGSIWKKDGSRVGKIKPTGATRSFSDTLVRQFGDTAILTGRITSKDSSGSYVANTTMVWVRQNNHWLVASAQWTEQKPGK